MVQTIHYNSQRPAPSAQNTEHRLIRAREESFRIRSVFPYIGNNSGLAGDHLSSFDSTVSVYEANVSLVKNAASLGKDVASLDKNTASLVKNASSLVRLSSFLYGKTLERTRLYVQSNAGNPEIERK